MTKILFVCMGNLCRSPIAEAIARQRAEALGLSGTLEFSSAGTHPPGIGEPADPRARQVGQRRGYDLTRHRTRLVSAADFTRFDLILAMDTRNLSILEGIAPPDHRAVVKLFLSELAQSDLREVPDPYYGSIAGFERVFDLCEEGMDPLLWQLSQR